VITLLLKMAIATFGQPMPKDTLQHAKSED
jgi:hypothetical protein